MYLLLLINNIIISIRYQLYFIYSTENELKSFFKITRERIFRYNICNNVGTHSNVAETIQHSGILYYHTNQLSSLLL